MDAVVLWQGVKQLVEDAVAGQQPFLATVIDDTAEGVRLRFTDEEAGSTERYGKLGGPQLTAGTTVVCIRFNGKPFVLGPLGIITGTTPTGSSVAVEDDNTEIIDNVTVLDFKAGFHVGPYISGDYREATIDLDFGTASTQVARGNHTHNLDALSDVTVASPATNQVLTWNGSVWTNQAPTGGGGGLTAIRVESKTVPVSTPNPTKALDFGNGFYLGVEESSGTDTDTDEVNVEIDFGAAATQVAAGDRAAPVLISSPRTGTYYTFPGLLSGYTASTFTATIDPNNTFYFPIFAPRSGTLNGLGLIREDTTAGNVAVKLGLFAMDPTTYAWAATPLREGVLTTSNGSPIAQYVTVTNTAITRGWYWVGIKAAASFGVRADDITLMAPTSVSFPWVDRTAGLRQIGTAYATPWAASSAAGTWQDTHDAYRVLLRVAV